MTEELTLTQALPLMAEEAQRNPEWWKKFERTGISWEDSVVWKTADSFGDFLYRIDVETRYRLKPRTVERTISYPEPLRDEPKLGAQVWVASAHDKEFCFSIDYGCRCPDWDRDMYFKRGLLHATKEAAAAHGRALAGVSND